MRQAHDGGIAELDADRELIVPLKERSVNDAEYVPAVAHPILVRKQRSGGLKLRSEAHAALSAEAVLQRRRDRLDVPVFISHGENGRELRRVPVSEMSKT